MKPVVWGIVSTALIGMEKVNPAMLKAKGVEVRGIASRDLKKAQAAAKQLGIPKAYGSYAEMFADPEIEAVYNPLPNHLHVPVTLEAMKAGKHVLCEKPITLTAAELDGLEDAAKRKGVLVEDLPNLAFMFGYTNAPWTLKSDIAGEYLIRLFKHMDANGLAVATPRDVEGCELDDGMLDSLQSGYVQRGKDVMPRQGSKLPWKVLMHFEKDSRMLLEDPIVDGALQFEARVPAAVTA